MDHQYPSRNLAGLPTHDVTQDVGLDFDYLYRGRPAPAKPSQGTPTVTMVAVRPAPAPRKARKARRWPLMLPVLGLLIGAIAWMGLGMPTPPLPFGSPGGTAQAAVAPERPSGPAVGPTPAARHITRTSYRVVFRLTGSAPTGLINVSYGSEAIPATGPGSAPFSRSVAWRPHTAYAINAELYGPGSIQDSITVRQIDHYSDGSRAVKNTTVSYGAANTDGGYASAHWSNI